jgi:hypothetical protein
MTTWLEGERSFFLGAQAFLVEDDREIAASWASPYVMQNAAYKYVLGRFVEADRANNNKQLFTLAGLQMARPTITHAPMNMNHAHRRVVGAFVATELVYPTGPIQAAAGEPCPGCGEPVPEGDVCPSCSKALLAEEIALNPYIEALGVFWKHYFPEDFALVEDAHAEGRLYYSMECIPAKIQCAGDEGCGATYEYAGRKSNSYCAHLNEHVSDKLLIQPHFTAGAILVPPVRPGWTHADVHSLVAKHEQLASDIYDGVKSDLGHLDPTQWESIMAELLVLATR